jgi:hypothetical protein
MGYMDGQVVVFVVLGIVLVVVVMLMNASNIEKDKRRIRNYLIARGMADIVVSRARSRDGGDHNTYDVAYTDERGQQKRTRCKIRHLSWTGDQDGIYWRDPI